MQRPTGAYRLFGLVILTGATTTGMIVKSSLGISVTVHSTLHACKSTQRDNASHRNCPAKILLLYANDRDSLATRLQALRNRHFFDLPGIRRGILDVNRARARVSSRDRYIRPE